MTVQVTATITARWFTVGGNLPVRRIVIHDEEHPFDDKSAEAVAAMFKTSTRKASAHYCLTPETLVLRSDLRWVQIGGLTVGDVLIATQEAAPGRASRSFEPALVLRVNRRLATCFRLTMEDGRQVTCSADHRWLVKHPRGNVPWFWRATELLEPGYRINAPVGVWQEERTFEAGWLAGLLDGEGCVSKVPTNRALTLSQKPGPVLDRAKGVLASMGIPFRIDHRPVSGVSVVSISGARNAMRLLGMVRPTRLTNDSVWNGRGLRSRLYPNDLAIAEVDRIGVTEVVSLETSTHTFLAAGMVSHNCVDADSTVRCVADKDIAYHAPPNAHSIGIERDGYATFTRDRWLSAYGQRAGLRQAQLVAELCVEHDVPPVRLSVADLLAGRRGICGHVDVTHAWHETTHTDPGPGFPWPEFMACVVDAHARLTGQEDDMTPEQAKLLEQLAADMATVKAAIFSGTDGGQVLAEVNERTKRFGLDFGKIKSALKVDG